MTLAAFVLSLGAACRSADDDEATAPPVDLLVSLVEGQVPGRLARNIAECGFWERNPGVWEVTCSSQIVFLVNLSTSEVVPGNSATRRQWLAASCAEQGGRYTLGGCQRR